MSLFVQPVSGGAIGPGRTDGGRQRRGLDDHHRPPGRWRLRRHRDGDRPVPRGDRHDPDPAQRHRGPADDRHGGADGHGREIRPQARPDLRHLRGQAGGDGPGQRERGGQLRPDPACTHGGRPFGSATSPPRPATPPGPDTVVLAINPQPPAPGRGRYLHDPLGRRAHGCPRRRGQRAGR